MQHNQDPQPNEAPSNPSRKRRRWLLVPLSSLLLALSIGVAFRLSHDAQLSFTAKRLPSRHNASVEPRLRGAQLADNLLTDSILSIIQSYYVDPERVENRSLLETALAAINTNSRVHAGAGPGAVWVQIDGGEKQIFPIKEQPSYQEVLDVVGAISRLTAEANITLSTGEMVEKNAPSSIMLLNSMLAELDAHSALLSPDAYRELRQGTEGSFGGLGVLVGIRDNLLTVIKPLPHSPAQRAGIRKRDRILGIGGVFTYGFSLDDLVEYMRGEPGSDVQLTMLRDGAPAPVNLKLKREVIHVDSVTSEEVSKNGIKILHITIESFASRTSREVLSAIKKFKAKNGGVMTGLILDLRANPGGLLDQAVQVSDLFLQSGVIVTTKGRREEVEQAGSGFDEVGFPMVVLIDGDSASASEIVAGALQDHQRAVVVGQPSFGKGSVQTVFELPGERALKLTIARYYTPAGRSIQNVGIMPDVWLQPLARRDTNENMFGAFRYKNERFLKKHLENVLPAEGGAAAVHVTPPQRFYYLRDVSSEDESEPAGGVDREMDFALKIIGKVHATYGQVLPKGTDRASHWLALAGPQLRADAGELDRATTTWLKDKHKIDWQTTVSPVNPELKIELKSTAPAAISPGEMLTLNYTVENREAVAVSHASIFIRSEAAGFDTKEILLGQLPAHGKRSGLLQVLVPSNIDPGTVQLRVGLAVDAWPVRGAVADFPLAVSERMTARLTAHTELVDELGGHVLGSLEKNESARLRIDLANEGDVDATDLDVKLVNLAGSQVQVLHDALTIETLEAGEQKHLYVDIKGGKTLVSAELAFGLFVQSPDLKLPFRQRFVISSKPSVSGQTAKNFTH